MDENKELLLPKVSREDELGEVKNYNLMDDLSSQESGRGLWASEEESYLDMLTLKSLFFNEDWVHICVDLLASEISNVPMRIMKQTEIDGKLVVEPAEDHVLQTLIENPNEIQDYSSWMYAITAEYVLMGNSVLWWAPKNRWMYVLPTERVCLDFDNSGKLIGYDFYQGGGMDFHDVKNTVAKFKAKDIIHIRRPNPSSIYWGLSAFIPGRKSILFNRYSQDYLNNFYLKGAAPSMILKLDKNANEEQSTRMLRSFEMAHTGRRNQRRTMVLPKGVDAQMITHSIADQQLVSLIDKNMEKIINILRIPKHALSLAQTGSLGSEEHKQALKFMWTSTVRPLLKKIAGGFNIFFKQELGEDYFFDFDLSDVELLKEDQDRKAELAIKMLSIKTLNEVREELYELAPLTGGDKLPGAQSYPSYGAPQEPKAPELEVEEPKAIVEVQSAEQNQSVDTLERSPGWKLSMDLINSHSELQSGNTKSIDEEFDKKVSSLEVFSMDILGQMASKSLKIVIAELSKKYGRKDDKTRALQKRLDEALDQLKTQWMDGYTDELTTSVEVGYGTQAKFVFDGAARERMETLRERDTNGRRSVLSARGLDTFKSVKDTTVTNQVLDTVARGIDEKKSVPEIAKELAQKFKIEIPGRAATIARTEVLTSISIGKAAAIENMKEAMPNKKFKKVWIATDDKATREKHQSYQGRGPVDEDFEYSKGLKIPRDVNCQDAADTINCRCDVIVVPSEDLGRLDDLPVTESNE